MIQAVEARKTAAKESAESSRTVEEPLIGLRKVHLAKIELLIYFGKLKDNSIFREDWKVIGG